MPLQLGTAHSSDRNRPQKQNRVMLAYPRLAGRTTTWSIVIMQHPEVHSNAPRLAFLMENPYLLSDGICLGKQGQQSVLEKSPHHSSSISGRGGCLTGSVTLHICCSPNKGGAQWLTSRRRITPPFSS